VLICKPKKNIPARKILIPVFDGCSREKLDKISNILTETVFKTDPVVSLYPQHFKRKS
jgi:hypothetical protein